ncbi:MAG: ISAs1 family transposase [Bacteroidales bacterium]|nr:ISAs1 family transposase [Bacteroidales bacterium]
MVRPCEAQKIVITAIPELLNMLDIEGCIITIDAMGTQKKIAETIIDKQADYILALKGNQGYLKEDVQNTFIRQQPDSTDQTVEKGHGRIETRKSTARNHLRSDYISAALKQMHWQPSLLLMIQRILMACTHFKCNFSVILTTIAS